MKLLKRIGLGLGAVLLFGANLALVAAPIPPPPPISPHIAVPHDGDPWPCYPLKVCSK